MSRFNNDFCGHENRGARWLTGNIRRKLTLFVVVILIMVISLFWFFTVYMLQPAYHNSIRNDLQTAVTLVTGVINDVENSGTPALVTITQPDGQTVTSLSDEVLSQLQKLLKNGTLVLDNRCLDIADSRSRNILLVDNIQPNCLLHLSRESSITDREIFISPEPNGELVMRVRQRVMADGQYEGVPENSNQIILGRTAANNQVTVIVSANLERIPQAVTVLKQLLMPLSLLLTLFSVTAAWVFSSWFTRPLSRLSAAAREMAKGNYDVRVPDCGEDEIGDLARDFNEMAQEVSRSAELQRDLMANVSHDLRTPLTLIKGYAETVRDLTGDDTEKRTEQLNVIVDESDKLSALVGSVMELSRMSSGIQKPELVVFDLFQLCDEMSYRYEMAGKKNGYQFVFAGQEGCYVNADPTLLERALHNLLGNAINHLGADLYVGLTIYKTNYGTVRVTVSDHGPGIDERDLPHIFDRYYRSRADAGKTGTGLGLSITKVIFESMDIHFGVQSRLGVGSTFWFEAPQATPPGKPNTKNGGKGTDKNNGRHQGKA